MLPKENHVLSKIEIQNLNKQGHNLSEDKLHIIKFLFNDKWNNAADPRPFRIKPSLVKTLAQDAIDMPYVYHPYDNTKHLRGTTEGKKDTAENLLEIQAKYSIGLIKVPLVTSTNNVYGIIEIWPEFEDDVNNNRLPEFTSITIFPIKEDADGIEEAQFLNINAVSSPGYPEILSGVHGVCKGGIKKCMAELAPLAASGILKDSRADQKSFSILKSKIGISMSADQGKATPSVETLAKEQEQIKSELTSNNQRLSSMETKVDAIAAKIGAGSDDKNKDMPKPPVGAAGAAKLEIPKELEGNEFVKNLYASNLDNSKKIKSMEDDNAAKEAKRLENLRNSQATSIVSKQILLKQVKAEDKDKEIKKLIEFKNEDGTLKDLEMLDNYLKAMVPGESSSPIGAGGSSDFPEFSGDHDSTPQISNSEIMRLD